MSNPKVRKGDAIIVTLARNGAPEDTILVVTSAMSGYLTVKNHDDNRAYNVYPNGNPRDEYILADRESRKKYLKIKIGDTAQLLEDMKRDLDILENYKTEEAYVAHKISEILKNKNDPDAIEIILKEFKKTSHL